MKSHNKPRKTIFYVCVRAPEFLYTCVCVCVRIIIIYVCMYYSCRGKSNKRTNFAFVVFVIVGNIHKKRKGKEN